MAEQGFPSQHTTTTTVTSSNTTVQTNIRFDALYIRTLPGMLKVGQIAFNLLGFISMLCSITRHFSRGEWFNTVAMGGFWFTGIMLVLYLFHVVEKFYRIPWLKIEFVFCAIWTVFYLIAASLACAAGNVSEANIVAGIFGYVAMVLYAYDAFLKFQGIRSGAIAQGDRVVNKSSSTTTSPAY
ncbi:Uncharacterized protein GBIM_00170 [Gryllus bimaculatus]|nr:Uncharacterized protein GBIM_00170 [Gryllus bimaculatus]